MLHGFRLLPPNAKPFVMGELGDLSESGDHLFLFYNFCVSCGALNWERRSTLATCTCIYFYTSIHVAPVGLHMCYVVIVWLWGGMFKCCFMLCSCFCNSCISIFLVFMSGLGLPFFLQHASLASVPCTYMSCHAHVHARPIYTCTFTA